MSGRVRGQLPKALIRALDAAEGGLRSFIEDERCAISDRSEAWQHGERCEALCDWLETLEEAADRLADCQAEPD